VDGEIVQPVLFEDVELIQARAPWFGALPRMHGTWNWTRLRERLVSIVEDALGTEGEALIP